MDSAALTRRAALIDGSNDQRCGQAGQSVTTRQTRGVAEQHTGAVDASCWDGSSGSSDMSALARPRPRVGRRRRSLRTVSITGDPRPAGGHNPGARLWQGRQQQPARPRFLAPGRTQMTGSRQKRACRDASQSRLSDGRRRLWIHGLAHAMSGHHQRTPVAGARPGRRLFRRVSRILARYLRHAAA